MLIFNVLHILYIKRNVLSPRTVKEYAETEKRLPDRFRNLRISDITQIQINRLINDLSKDQSPKTVRNYHGFVSAVLGVYRPKLKICRKNSKMSLTRRRERM